MNDDNDIIELRVLSDADIDPFFREINDFDIVKMTGSIPFPVTREWVIERFETKNKQEKGGGVADRALYWRDQFIGNAGYFTNEDDNIEVGYWIARPFWGQGLATRVTHLIVELARSHGHKGTLYAGHAKDNLASGRVLAKAGFIPDGENVFRPLSRGEDVPCWRLKLPPLKTDD
ncbi:GNAT family N-acetyltransferase [Kordiimonas sp. SCSIO 12610]|uniref:GNAT family N-acetyltransferase n=1 Tax=Kordiimonas sp. SCSIO 12610 TaxID=2829597 RepID=UPI002108BA7A|nr:GNAT family N-acetyltransferase [Kordiimonas sp. SCSIO 12610]UTW55992.1 GNAT family N-acetyltransferase [Kordiimonas sp. SCSIO 12610]